MAADRRESVMLFGALEAGGTKMVCAIGNEQGEIPRAFPPLP